MLANSMQIHNNGDKIAGPQLGLALYLSSLFKKCVHANLPQTGFELGSLDPQAVMLPNEPTLLV